MKAFHLGHMNGDKAKYTPLARAAELVPLEMRCQREVGKKHIFRQMHIFVQLSLSLQITRILSWKLIKGSG